MTNDTYDARAACLFNSAMQIKHHEGACLEFFQAIECFEPTFIEAHKASNMIHSVRSFKSRLKACSSLEVIITYSNKRIKDSKSNMAVGIGWLGNWN